MPQSMNERQRQRFLLLGEEQAKAIIDALADECIEPELLNPTAIEAVRAWGSGWCRIFGIAADEMDARLAQELAARLQFTQRRCKPA